MNRQIKVISATFAFLSVCCVAIATAQITETKLIESDGVASDWFGISVSLSGDYALVGATGDDDNGSFSGSSYIFHHDGSNWVEQTKLVAIDGAAYDYFGTSVSLSGDYALIGATYDDDNGMNAGSAYIFHFDGSSWVEQTKLTASDGASDDHFGVSVSLSGDYALVGADGDNHNGTDAGSAYVFHYDGSNWVEQTKLIANDGAEEDYFGRSVSLSGDYVLIGAPVSNGNVAYAGAAYIFRYDGSNWVEQTKLIASDGAGSDEFGGSVSLSGDYAVIGATGDDGNGPDAGSAYIFHYDGPNWAEQTKLTGSDGDAYDYFGQSVSLSGDYILVGAYLDDLDEANIGSAYIFHRDGSNWVEQTKVIASDGASDDHFGVSVSLSSDYALVGAWLDDNYELNAGSAYVYSGFASICDDIFFFNAKCNMIGAAQAMVKMTGNWTGETVTFDLDGVNYVSTVMSNGINSIAKMTVPHAGMGSHTVTLEDPAGCYSPVTFNCQVDALPDPGWDALWAEYDALEAQALKALPTETGIIGQPVLGLAGNYPNPFNPSTTIRYALSVDSPVSVRVYNMLGQEVATLVNGFQKAGDQSVVWHGTNNFGQSVASGLYIYRLQAGNTVVTEKMMFTK